MAILTMAILTVTRGPSLDLRDLSPQKVAAAAPGWPHVDGNPPRPRLAANIKRTVTKKTKKPWDFVHLHGM